MYMALYGGIYVDIDFVAVRSFDQLLQLQGPDANVFLGQDCGLQVDWSKPMRKQKCPDYAQSLPNAFLASTAGHPFWHHVIVQILREAWASGSSSTDWNGAIYITGPVPLFRAVSQYNQYAVDNGLQSDIHVLTDEVYPLSWTQFSPWTEKTVDIGCCFLWDSHKFNVDCCREQCPNAIVMTFWTALWHET
jgi:mannosyltransferase OCH1-like enzyme